MALRRWQLMSVTILGTAATVAVWPWLFRDALRPADRRLARPSPQVVDSPFAGLAPRPAIRPRSGASQASPSPTESSIRLVEVSERSGVSFLHQDGSSGRHFTPETMSAGVATFDYDGDGLADIYLPNGAALLGVTYDPPPRHALYKNVGSSQFQDVTEQAGLARPAFGLGIAVADYDNDGFPDIYLNNFGPNLLYHNNGDGTFTDVTAYAGVPGTIVGGQREKKVGAGACFLDSRGLGRLDLFVGNYVEIELGTYVTPMKGNYAFYPSPLVYNPVPSAFYQNTGDGVFVDASESSGVNASRGRCMGVIACDYDNDGATDVFVCNDVQENFLFHNDGHGDFTQVGLTAGIAIDPSGASVANMAVDAGDYNNDGRLDFYTTNYDQQFPLLLHNLGDGMFTNVALAANAGQSCYPYVKWGCALADFDNDGYKDILVVNGHTDDNVEVVDSAAHYRCHNILLRNLGHETFVDVSQECGLNAIPVHAGRGVAVDDLDNDGDLDVVILNSRERPTILSNVLHEQGCRHHWLQVQLRGVTANRDGVGAHVKVVAGDLTQLDEVHSGRGYQSHWGTRLHFGLGRHERADQIEVRWVGGGVDVLENVAVDRLLTITEGAGRDSRGAHGTR